MTWIKIDDGFLDNRKFLRVGPLAGYLHIAAIAWSNRNLTDGVIPREQPPRLASWHVINDDLNPEVVGKIPDHQEVVSWLGLVASLLDNGLWEELDDGDYLIHDYLEHQRSSSQVREDRDKNAIRQANWRNGRRNGVTNGTRHSVHNRPVTGAKSQSKETEEEPPLTPPPAGGRKRETGIWNQTAADWSRAVGVDGPNTTLVKAVSQSAPWTANGDAPAVFRAFCRQHFPSLNVSEENAA